MLCLLSIWKAGSTVHLQDPVYTGFMVTLSARTSPSSYQLLSSISLLLTIVLYFPELNLIVRIVELNWTC